MKLEQQISKTLPKLRASTKEVDKIAYARDLWPRHHIEVRAGRIAEHKPGLIVWPESADEVSAIVRFCEQEGRTLVPFGAGSGVCGAVLPDEGTVVVDLKRFNDFRVDREEGVVDVGAGALGIRIEEDLNALGFSIGHFPSSILCSTVGGWIAARGAGQCSGRYGKIEDMVSALDCVVGGGDRVTFRRRSEGPDLTPLIVGSEGVLGIVTRARLRLHNVPAYRSFSAYSFPTLSAGWDAMREMFQRGLRPSVARLYDPFDSLMAKIGSVKKGKPSGSRSSIGSHAALQTLLRSPGKLNKFVDFVGDKVFRGSRLILIFEGEEAAAKEDSEIAATLAKRYRARSLGEAPARHWLSHRYSVSYRQAPVFMGGAFSDTMEVAATWSKLAGLYEAVRAAASKNVFIMAHLSHAYPDGCSIYFTFAGAAENDEASLRLYDETWTRMLEAAISAGGTLSHHHGVGRSKAPKLGQELGLGIDVIRALMRGFDPRGIFNRGNLLPLDAPKRDSIGIIPGSPTVDHNSLTVEARGSTRLSEIERVLRPYGQSLSVASHGVLEMTVNDWIGAGCLGAPDPWLDPADHLVPGFVARLASGSILSVRPCPRRAVGPDLFALFHGMRGRVGTIESAHLRIHSANRARPLHTSVPRSPAIDEAEQRYIDCVASVTSVV